MGGSPPTFTFYAYLMNGREGGIPRSPIRAYTIPRGPPPLPSIIRKN